MIKDVSVPPHTPSRQRGFTLVETAVVMVIIGLMIGGMVESTLAMSMSACFAAGQGGFTFVDLDTPLFMVDSPLEGGMRYTKSRIDLQHIEAGHGVTPRG